MNSLTTINILDIGSSKIQCLIIQLDSRGELEVIGCSQKEFSTPLLNQGNIINVDKVAKMIREVVSNAELMAGVEVGGCFINVPGLLCQGIRSHGLITITSKEDGEKKIFLSDLERVIDIAESTPIPQDHTILHSMPIEFKVDGLRVDEDPQGMVGMRLEAEVYILTCPKGVLDNLKKVVERAGYELQDVFSESIACAEVVLSEEEKRSGSLVLDMGGQFTNAVFYLGDSVNLTFSIPLGADSLTRDLSIGFSTGLVEAEEIKRQYGVLDYQLVDEEKIITVKLIAYQKKTHISQKAVFQILEARMSEIMSLLKRGLHDKQAVLPVGCGIVLAGGGSLTPGIEIVARNVFNQSARVGHPLGVTGVPQVSQPNYATALGIAQMVFSKEKISEEYEDVPQSGVLKKLGSSLRNFFT